MLERRCVNGCPADSFGSVAIGVDLSPGETGAIPFPNRHHHIAPAVAVEVGPGVRGELDPEPLRPTDVWHLNRQGGTARGDHANRRVGAPSGVEGYEVALVDPAADLETVRLKVRDDRVRLPTGVDADSQIVERILDRLGLRTPY